MNLDVGYQYKQVIYGASVNVDAGEFVALIGHNGAGKTTLLKAICGYLKATRGSVTYKGENITNKSPAVNVRKGLSFVHQEKSLFPNLSVLENLQLAAYAIGKTDDLAAKLEDVYQTVSNSQGQGKAACRDTQRWPAKTTGSGDGYARPAGSAFAG